MASLSDYEKWVGRLYRTPLFHPSGPLQGMARMKKLHGLLGNPMNDPQVAVIHIAGTNGKGSVAWKLAKTLEALGYPNVGLYTSPHVSCFRERIQWTHGRMISEEEVAQGLQELFGICHQHHIPATFFDLVTLLAFWFFDQCRRKASSHSPGEPKKTVIVLETGLGGRWDATNVVETPVLAIITSIGLDHTGILGTTMEQIALEKAGIMKPECPVLVGHQVPQDTLRQYAQENSIGDYHQATMTEEELGSISDPETNDTHSSFDYDITNTQLARAAMALLQSRGALGLSRDIPAGLLEESTLVRPPCRFETLCAAGETTVVLDVAHNPPAMHSLVQKLRNAYPDKQFRFVLGMSKDKDWRGILQAFLLLMKTEESDKQPARLSKIHLVQAVHYKALPLNQLVDNIMDTSNKEQHTNSGPSSPKPSRIDSTLLDYNLLDPSVTYQLQRAIAMAAKKAPGQEVVVVCGSVFLMAEVRQAMGLPEPCDTPYLLDILRTGSIGKSASQDDAGPAFGNGERPPLP